MTERENENVVATLIRKPIAGRRMFEIYYIPIVLSLLLIFAHSKTVFFFPQHPFTQIH